MISSGPNGNGGDPYQSGAVTTASPWQLVLMMYDAALAAVGRAQRTLQSDGIADRIQLIHTELVRAQDIIVELQLTLDHDKGGEIAQSLSVLYDFCLDRLVTANTRKDAELLPAVANVLGELRSGWIEASGEQAA